MNTANGKKEYIGEHAIVIGGGFTGLLGARVLSDHFKKVTVIEKGPASEDPVFNPINGVPQISSTHHLHFKGASILRELFPNIEEKLIQNGSHKIDILNDFKYYFLGWKQRSNSGKYTYTQSRALLDRTLRSLLEDQSNVFFLDKCEVKGLLVNFKEDRMTGVSIYNNESKEESNLYGNFVVDASGVNTVCPDWLEGYGYKKPASTEIKVNLKYFSRICRVPEKYQDECKFLLVKNLKFGNLGTITEIEKDSQGRRWLATIAGQVIDPPITNEEELLENARKLEQPNFYEIVKESTQLTQIYPFTFPKVRRYYYEDLERLPGGFIAMGDALCAWSPANAAGLTVSAATAQALKQVLMDQKEKQNLNTLTRNYFARMKKITNAYWIIFAQVEFIASSSGKIPLHLKFFTWYRNSVMKLSNTYPEIWRRLYEVTYYEKPLIKLFSPFIFYRVLLQWIKQK